MEVKKSKNLLSKNKQEELAVAEQNCIDAGVQYNVGYEKYGLFRAVIDTPEKRDAIKFILGDLIELAELNFQLSPVIEQLGDPETKTELNYREFKLLQEVIKAVRIKGRDNHIRLSKAMKAFNSDGEYLNNIEEENKLFIQKYQEASNYYGKVCNKFGIMPENLDARIDEATEAHLAESRAKAN